MTLQEVKPACSRTDSHATRLWQELCMFRVFVGTDGHSTEEFYAAVSPSE